MGRGRVGETGQSRGEEEKEWARQRSEEVERKTRPRETGERWDSEGKNKGEGGGE